MIQTQQILNQHDRDRTEEKKRRRDDEMMKWSENENKNERKTIKTKTMMMINTKFNSGWKIIEIYFLVSPFDEVQMVETHR